MSTGSIGSLLASHSPPLVMGILNVTPDSFSDGGDFLDQRAAIDRAMAMVREGADIVDVGPESTRPGSQFVSADEQIARSIPVIEGIRRLNDGVLISIDARLAPVVAAAMNAGADIVNDTSALRDDPALVDLISSANVDVILMHRCGTPVDMQRDGGPVYADAVREIMGFLEERVRFTVEHGVDRSRIVVDPGIGFGKRIEHNLLILRDLRRLVAMGLPVLVGASRKNFIGQVLGGGDPARTPGPRDRVAGSLACAAIATMAGASILRVHDVRETVEIARVCAAARDGLR